MAISPDIPVIMHYTLDKNDIRLERYVPTHTDIPVGSRLSYETRNELIVKSRITNETSIKSVTEGSIFAAFATVPDAQLKREAPEGMQSED